MRGVGSGGNLLGVEEGYWGRWRGNKEKGYREGGDRIVLGEMGLETWVLEKGRLRDWISFGEDLLRFGWIWGYTGENVWLCRGRGCNGGLTRDGDLTT